MNTYLTAIKEKEYEKFSHLRRKIEKERTQDVRRRISQNPSPTVQESVLGAFIEMYEPHLRPLVNVVYKKGYALDVSSGFCGKYDECQAFNSSCSIDDISVNKLAKIGVKVQNHMSMKSMRFWPEKADIETIVEKYEQIAALIPVQKEPAQPSLTNDAANFRMTYIPHDTQLKRQRLFEILMFDVLKSMSKDIQKRITENPRADEVESTLGVFMEMIEPQVREAVLELYRKGYTIDAAGFMNTAHTQALDGDFVLEETVRQKVETVGVVVETNPSGYTRIEFHPQEADIKSMKKQWNQVAAMFPNRGKKADFSMTRTAREFRKKY